jgi:hypothetical protein
MSQSVKATCDVRTEVAVLYAVGQAVYESSGQPIAAARTHAEARRIAAALNIANGIPTDDLEEWSIDSVRDPSSDLQAHIESILAPAPGQDNRGRDRRQKDRRLPLHEVRIDSK